MLAVFPVLGGLRGPQPLQRRRQVEKVQRLSGSSAVARALEQVYLPELHKPIDEAEPFQVRPMPASPLKPAHIPVLQRFREPEIEAMGLAMIGAAQADGRIDGEERLRMVRLIHEAGGDAQDAAFLQQHLEDDIDPAMIAKKVSDPDVAREVYAAALLAIHIDSASERAWLHRLAHALALPTALVGDLHRQAGVEPPADPLNAG